MKASHFGSLILLLPLGGCELLAAIFGQTKYGDTWNNLVDVYQINTTSATNTPEIVYGNNDSFNRALYGSMKGDTPKITVSFEGEKISVGDLKSQLEAKDGSNAIVPWVGSVSAYGGQTIFCDVSGLQSPIEDIVLGILNSVLSGLVEYQTYAPAKDYNVKIGYSGSEGAPETERPVELVQFVEKSNSNFTCGS